MSEVTDILKKHNIRADKGMSQNFLIDARVIDKIISAAGLDEKTTVIEIGSGPGSLTKELLKSAGRVIAIELDKRLCKVLGGEYGCERLEVLNADIMKTDLNPLIRGELEKGRIVKVCANLPYHITTPVIMMLLEDNQGLESLTLMMQREVADRVLSKPGSKEYGSITPAIRYYSDVELVTNVPPHCFIPRPSVHSSVVRFRILTEKRVAPKSEKLMFLVIRAAFGQRRKTLFNALSNQLLPKIGMSREKLMECFSEETGIPASVRGETLGLGEFAALSDIILEKIGSFPEM